MVSLCSEKLLQRQNAKLINSSFNILNILPSTGQENNTARPKKRSYFASHLIFHLFFFSFSFFGTVVTVV